MDVQLQRRPDPRRWSWALAMLGFAAASLATFALIGLVLAVIAVGPQPAKPEGAATGLAYRPLRDTEVWIIWIGAFWLVHFTTAALFIAWMGGMRSKELGWAIVTSVIVLALLHVFVRWVASQNVHIHLLPNW